MATSSNYKTALELSELIKNENVSGKERIPSTDSHMKIWTLRFDRNEEELRNIIKTLRDAHFIFIINLVSVEDEANSYLHSQDSYIYADASILNELKKYTEAKLEKVYESTQYKKKSAFQITKELFPKLKEYNNTPLGHALNEAIMVEEYYKTITNTAFEYTDSWRQKKLQELYRDEIADQNREKEISSHHSIDEIDSSSFNSTATPTKITLDAAQLEQLPYWERLTHTFPIEFLIRIHFRKYEFDIIRKLILTGKIHDEKDLKYIRDTLQIMESKIKHDNILKKNLDVIIELRRIAQTKMNLLRKSGSQR
jgi:hypothetical protein